MPSKDEHASFVNQFLDTAEKRLTQTPIDLSGMTIAQIENLIGELKRRRDELLNQPANDAQSSPAPGNEISVERRQILDRLALLTDHEHSVLALIIDGLPNKTIAARLNCGLRTVEARRRSILQKMQVDSAITLVRDVILAYRGLPHA